MTESLEQSHSTPNFEQVIKILGERGVKRECPRCGNQQWNLVPGYFTQVVQSDLKNISLAGQSIPTIVLVCINCGYISQHSMGRLGLLPKEEEKKNE